MTEFTVSQVKDGDTFKVKCRWKWNQRSGDTVRASGYNAPEKGESGYEEAKQKLKELILNISIFFKNSQ